MRLDIGASRIQLALPESHALRSGQWVHLGDPEPLSVGEPVSHEQSPHDGYLSFYYQRGDRLPFADGTFSFAFSEHFFEHLFMDEACELLKECFRVLRPGACFRIAVPDADLRTYMEPEPVGYSTGDPRWFHPDKHNTRWSIYSLAYALEQIGFVTRGVVYCDKYGTYHVHPPDREHEFYATCLDQEIIQETRYVSRFLNSLVVDARKPMDDWHGARTSSTPDSRGLA